MAGTTIRLRDGLATLQSGISKLQNALEDDFNFNPEDRKELADLLTTAFQMCVQRPTPLTPELFGFYGEVYRTYLTTVYEKYLSSKQGEDLLRELERRWSNQAIMTKWMGIVFQYLDRFYTKAQGRENLKDVALRSFTDNVFMRVHDKASSVVLDLIKKERDGETIPRQLVQTILRIFVECGMGRLKLSLYVEHFQKKFLRMTEEHYKVKSQQWSLEDSATEFLKKAEARIAEEEARVDHYLHQHTRGPLLQVVCEQILAKHQMHIIQMENSGLRALLRDQRKDDLTRMFRLFEHVDDGSTSGEFGLEPMQRIFCEHIVEEGKALVKEEEDSTDKKSGEQFIPKILAVHDVFLDLVTTAFHGHHKFQKALKNGFDQILAPQVKGQSFAERIATYCDRILRRPPKGEQFDDNAIEDSLDKIVRLVGYLPERDVYGEFYRKLLAKRLLQNRSASMDSEKQMISKLKYQYGGAFTSKLEGMLRDKTLSEDSTNLWKDHVKGNDLNLQKIDFNVQVLTHGFWPTDNPDPVTLPAELLNCVELFHKFYTGNNSKRVLNWHHMHGNGEVVGHFMHGTSKYNPIIVMTTYQMCVSLMFNERDVWTLAELQEATKLPKEEVKKALVSLSADKYPVLKREDGQETRSAVKPESKYAFNPDCLSKTKKKPRKFQIPSVQTRISERDRTVTNQTVVEDRKHLIDAALVRIMKARKELEHNNLINEAIDQLKSQFTPHVPMIKKRIEDLITRDYLERAPDNQSKYRYMA